MFSTEMLLAYDEYLIDCEWEGIAPMSFLSGWHLGKIKSQKKFKKTLDKPVKM